MREFVHACMQVGGVQRLRRARGRCYVRVFGMLASTRMLLTLGLALPKLSGGPQHVARTRIAPKSLPEDLVGCIVGAVGWGVPTTGSSEGVSRFTHHDASCWVTRPHAIKPKSIWTQQRLAPALRFSPGG